MAVPGYGTQAWGASLESGGGGGGGEVTPPVVTMLTDTTEIGRDDVVSLTVTDGSGLAQVIITADYPTLGLRETIYDSGKPVASKFAYKFRTSSTSNITGGLRFNLTRVGGWLAAPVISVRPVDIYGNKPVGG